MRPFLPLFMSILIGCAVYPVGLVDSSTPLIDYSGQTKQYQVLGKSEGTQGYVSLFGLIPFGDYNFDEAINDAVTKLNGDAMINVRYWYRVTNYFIVSYFLQ